MKAFSAKYWTSDRAAISSVLIACARRGRLTICERCGALTGWASLCTVTLMESTFADCCSPVPHLLSVELFGIDALSHFTVVYDKDFWTILMHHLPHI